MRAERPRGAAAVRAASRAWGLPRPTHRDVAVERDLRAPMDDGVDLLADRWFPTGAPDAPTVLAGDAELVREVVDNLVGNALKHAGAAGPVTVTVRSEGEQVRLDVRDQGPGIVESEQSALFERWSRTDASRAALVPGLGLGLSIVKRLVLAHGGLLGVSSRAGEGATFWVTFPAAVPVPVTAATAEVTG